MGNPGIIPASLTAQGRGMARKTETRARKKTASKATSKKPSKPAAKAAAKPASKPSVKKAEAPVAPQVASPAPAQSTRVAAVHEPLLVNEHIALKRCRHGWFMFNRNDKFVGRSLDRYGEWCQPELEILTPLLRPGRVVLDIGAFIGSHTVYFAQQVGPRGRVYAFEPQRHAFQMLCGNVALNALTNVTCLPYVIGKETGVRRLGELSQTIAENFGGTQALVVPAGEPTRTVRVDDLELPRCDVMKIDVEGMELDVLAGAGGTIERCKPMIYCENNRAERSGQILSELMRHGYKIWWHILSYYNPNNYFAEKENIFAPYWPEANILCVHESARVVVKNLMEVTGPTDDWQQALDRLKNRAKA